MKYKYLYQNILSFFTKISNFKSWKIFKIILATNFLSLIFFSYIPCHAVVSFEKTRNNIDSSPGLASTVNNFSVLTNPATYQDNNESSDDGIDYINFENTFKIYTNYLPPKTSSSRGPNQHYLDPCSDNTMEHVGEYCMYKIAPNCPESGTGAGINCIKYSTSFDKPSNTYKSDSGSTKNLKPKSCDSGSIQGNDCFNFSTMPYCSEVSSPVLGLNCKLPPCAFLPNTFFRRPGVNCMANCLDTTKNQIIKDFHFMEGINCLTPCSSNLLTETTPTDTNYSNGNCVLTFLSYVTPFCNKTLKTNIAKYNLAYNRSVTFPRSQCINLEDLPICSVAPANNIDFVTGCAKECPASGGTHGVDCINKNISKYCHHKYFNESEIPKCQKMHCSQLTPDELNNTNMQNSTDFTSPASANFFSSDERYCNTVPYDNLTYDQLKSNASEPNKYLKIYKLAKKPCVPYDGTSFNMAILGSQFFTKASSVNILQEINNQCGRALNIGSTINCKLDQYSTNPDSTQLFDQSISCMGANRVESILCTDYNSNQSKPNDCNSSIPHAKNNCTKDGNDNSEKCCPTGALNCYKTEINCDLDSNKIYNICKNIQIQTQQEPDHQLSWFFRPSISPHAIHEISGSNPKQYETWSIHGHAFEDNPPTTNLNDGLRLHRFNIQDRNWLNWDNVFTYSGPTSPGAWSDGLFNDDYATGLDALCGVNNMVDKPPSSEGAYYKGEVKTLYKDDSIEHKVTICLRKRSPGGLFETSCGLRKCRSFVTLATAGASCGRDICRTVTVKSSTSKTFQEACTSDDFHFKMGIPDLANAFRRNAGGMAAGAVPVYGQAAAAGTAIVTGAQAEEQAVYNLKPCMANFESHPGDMTRNVRVRTYNPDPSTNFLCSVIEMRNVSTMNGNDKFFKGHEFFLVPTDRKNPSSGKRFYRKLCFSGKFNSVNGKCENGINYNDDINNLYLWRAARIVKYVDLPPTVKCGDNLDRDCDDSNSSDDNLEYNSAYGLFTLKHYGFEYFDRSYGGTITVSNKISRPNPTSSNPNGKIDEPIRYHIGRKDYTKRVLLEKSDCIKHQLRLSTPINYAVATNRNSQRLFLPSIKIDRLCSGTETGTDCNESLTTDFFSPSLTVLWGIKAPNDTPSLSTSMPYHYKKISIPVSNVNSDSSQKYTLTPNVAGLPDTITQDVVIKKLENENGPIICLYKRNSSSTNPSVYSDVLIGCKPRNFATGGNLRSSDRTNKPKLINEINNFMALIKINKNQSYQICQTPKISQETFGKKIKLHAGKNNIIFNTTTASSPSSRGYEKIMTPYFNFNHPQLNALLFQFSEVIDFKNFNNLIVCETTRLNQGYEACLKRDKCSILNYECLNNEKLYLDEIFKNVDIQNIEKLNQYIRYRKFCLETLLPQCNKLKGLEESSTNTILNPNSVNGFNQPSYQNYYGWFNEVCIEKGVYILDNKSTKKYVIQNNPINRLGEEEDSILGKCITDATGNCILHDTLPTAGPGQKARLATPHELGLCISFEQFRVSCQPIRQLTNPIISDKYFTSDLINVHQTHLNRANGINKSDGTKFYAEFDISFPGNRIYGECNGFWRENFVKPYAECNSSGNLVNFTNSCIRYTCPLKTVPDSGADQFGNYPGTYDSVPTAFLSQKGKFHGYAKWPAKISSDAKQDVVSNEIVNGKNSCLPGYKRANSNVSYKTNYLSTNKNNDLNSDFYRILSDSDKLAFNAIFGNVSSYTGGDAPSRKCNQLGEWEEVINPCQRITCPPLDFARPADENSFDLNAYKITISGNLIRIESSPLNGLDVNKIKFRLDNNVNQSTIFVNPTDSSDFNNIALKDTNGSTNVTSLISGVDYVFELISSSSANYWKRLPNANDAKYRLLWQQTGGAKFPQGYAHRSTTQYYRSDPIDLLDQSYAEGECQESLGYKHLENTSKPTLFCNTQGNWTALQNQCMSDCSEINEGMSTNDVHGYALWNKSSGSITESLFVTSSSCSRGYLKYPYNPPYDEEGDKGDYGENASVELLTSDDFDGTATTSDGSLYISSIATSSPDRTYDLKIVSTATSTLGPTATYGPIGDSIFELYNNSSITLNASNNTVWSDIKFASYGTPDYSNPSNLRVNPICNSEYSRLNIAKRCIGNRTCTLSLSDFSSYDNSLSCDINTGNGKNGVTSTNRNFGSGGGGGGGNFLNSSQNGGQEGQVGISGVSYCDRYFHLLNNCEFSSAENKGLKVDLTQPLTNALGIRQFDGKNGYAIVKQYTNNSCSGTPTATTYNLPGLQTYIVSGSSTSEFCIEYELAGAGGGGGGAGINFGTDGDSGGKITGKFKVKGGTSINLYIGQGGKAGKSRCVRETGASASLDHNFYNNFASKKIIKNNLAITNFASKNSTKNILVSKNPAKNNLIKTGLVKTDLAQNNLAKNNIKNSDFVKNKSINKNHTQFNQFKYLAKSFNHQPIFAKLTDENNNKKSIANLYNKISEVFISKGWGNNGWSNYVQCDNGLGHNESVKVNDCPGYDKGSSWKKCNCPWPTQDPYAILYHDDMNSSVIGDGYRSGYYYFDVQNDVMSSFSLGPYTQILLGGGQSEGWFGPIVNNNSYQNNYYTEWVNNLNNCNYNNRGKDCNDDVNDIVIYLYKVCNTYTYPENCECNEYRHHNGSSCVNNYCYAPDAFGIKNEWGYYASGNNTNCTRPNTTGTFNWQCNSNNNQINISYNGCRCATGYRQSGNDCIPNTCTANPITGFNSKNYDYPTTSLNCDGTGYNGSVTVSSCTTNGTRVSPTGPCNLNTCTASAATGFTLTTYRYNPAGTSVSLSCDSNFDGNIIFPNCDTNNATKIHTTNNCKRKCNISSSTYDSSYGFTVGSSDYAVNGTEKVYSCFLTSANSAYNGGSAKFSCDANGTLTLNQSCTCATGYVLSSGKCVMGTKCTIPTSGTPNYNSDYGLKDVATNDFVLGSTTKIFNSSNTEKTYSCQTTSENSAYNGGTPVFNCPVSGSSGTLTFTAPCNCATNYAYNLYGDQKKCVRKCTITSADATYWGIATSGASTIFETNDYILNGSNNIYPNSSTSKGASYNCASTPDNPAYNGGTITLSCGTSGNLTIGSGTGCNCASGYRKRANNSCEINICTRMVAGSGISLTGIDFENLSSDNKQGAKTANCNVANFSGTFNYVCGSNGTMTVTQNNCNCAEGFNFNTTTQVCEAITCSAPETNGYVAKTNLPFTLGTTKGKIFCQKEGYHGFAEYTCKNGTGTNGTFTAIISPNNCQQIICTVPSDSNLTQADGSNQPWGSFLSCKTGYRQQTQALIPYIQCNATFDSTNNYASVIASTNQIQNPCVLVTCLVQGTAFYMVNYNASTVNVADCSVINTSWYGTGSYNCNSDGTFQWVNQCRTTTCQIPACTSACTSPNCHCPSSAPAQNTSSDGQLVYNSSSQITLNCKTGWESADPPRYTCTISSNAPLLNLFGTPCTRIQCRANNSLNSIIDNTLVDETVNEFVSTSCKAGYYQPNPSSPPIYKCSISKVFTFQNPCEMITCPITPTTPSSFGMIISSGIDYRLSWTGTTPTTVSCNEIGYTGNITYTCGGSTNPGNLTISSNTCEQSICIRSHGGKNTSTFDEMMILNSSSDNKGLGGGKNPDESPTNAGFNFLKGGNGGNSSVAFTSGAGGGGGQASMIAINNKIIAIAGGGGGGAGGGKNINNNSSLPFERNFKLLANVFGNYLYLKISNLGININEASTAGVFSARNTSNNIDITAPNAKLINKIEFSTLGNPILSDSLLSSFDLKHGTCKVNSDRYLNICLSETSCSITDLNSKVSGSCMANDMGVVASYVFTEPKLRFGSEANALLIKELSGVQLISPTLENNKVYTFYKLFDESNYWIKSTYAVNNIYLVQNPTRIERFKVKFHRTNTSFEPKLKLEYNTGSIILPIKKGLNKNLSIGYINHENTYILTNISGLYWEIKKYIPEEARKLTSPEFPSRTCSTVKLENNITRMWSGTSSKCINKCPGFNYDDRIGAGATLHRGKFGYRKVKWPEANLNSKVILKINAASTETNNSFGEFTGDIAPNQFTGNEDFFILSRHCNADGSWSDPVYLCQVSGGSSSKPETTPPNSYNEYLIGSPYNNIYGDSVKYIEANNNHDLTNSECLDGFNRDVSEGTVYSNDLKLETSRYKCVYESANVNAKFVRILGTNNRCIKYCSTASIDGSKYSVSSPATLIKPNSNITISCKLPYLSDSSDKTSSTHSCKGDATWDAIANACRLGNSCEMSSITGDMTEDKGAWAINPGKSNKGDFFPLKLYLANVNVTGKIANGKMPHGAEYTFPRSSHNERQAWRYGRCGYIRWKSHDIAGSSCVDKFSFVRKYLSKIKCNDGTYEPTWYDETESDARHSCSGWSEVDAGCKDEGGTGLNGGNYVGNGRGSAIGNISDYDTDISEQLIPPPDPSSAPLPFMRN